MSLREIKEPWEEKMELEMTRELMKTCEKMYEYQEEKRQWRSFVFHMIWWGVLVLAGIIIFVLTLDK